MGKAVKVGSVKLSDLCLRGVDACTEKFRYETYKDSDESGVVPYIVIINDMGDLGDMLSNEMLYLMDDAERKVIVTKQVDRFGDSIVPDTIDVLEYKHGIVKVSSLIRKYSGTASVDRKATELGKFTLNGFDVDELHLQLSSGMSFKLGEMNEKAKVHNIIAYTNGNEPCALFTTGKVILPWRLSIIAPKNVLICLGNKTMMSTTELTTDLKNRLQQCGAMFVNEQEFIYPVCMLDGELMLREHGVVGSNKFCIDTQFKRDVFDDIADKLRAGCDKLGGGISVEVG